MSGDLQLITSDPVLHELDGIARLPAQTHVLMATARRDLEKVRSDIAKLNAAARLESARGFPVVKWLITEQQLQAPHQRLARENDVHLMTLQLFQSRIFNASDYLGKRRTFPFGSARNLRDNSVLIPDDEYIGLPLTVTATHRPYGEWLPSDSSVTLQELIALLSNGSTIVLTGPFGAGKSLSLREVCRHLATSYHRDSTRPVPVAINLREHWGAQYADEIFERHARSVGLVMKESLTIAYRAGIAFLLLDGFDEMASQVIGRPTDKQFMRTVRREALQAVRDLLEHCPPKNGALICGRDHYFDDLQELSTALGLHGRECQLIEVGEFTEAQVSEFLERHSRARKLPDWLPRKPLILGYLSHLDLLDEVLRIDSTAGFGYAWDEFLRLLCGREASLPRAAMDPVTIRRVLERLSSAVRGTSSGVGPMSAVDMAEAYLAETGDPPGEAVLMQLQRLPGLTQRDQDPGTRAFVDQDFLAALQGSALARIIRENRPDLVVARWLSGAPRDTIRMAAYLLSRDGFDYKTIFATAGRFASLPVHRLPAKQLAADTVLVGLAMADDLRTLDLHGMMLAEADIVDLDLEEVVLSGVVFRDCTIKELSVDESLVASNIRFDGCVFDKISGVGRPDALPAGMFANCQFGSFDNHSTNAAILRSDLSDRMKALHTVLRKVYVQAGGGRKTSALRRGVPQGPIHDAIPQIIDTLTAANMIWVGNDIVHPIRRNAARVHRILSEGALSQDPVVMSLKG